MLLPVPLCLIPHVLSMNEISALGHAALWKKYARKNSPSAVIANAESPHPLPSRTIDSQQVPCSPLQPRTSSPDQLASASHRDKAQSIEIEQFEEQHAPPLSPVISRAYHPDMP